MSSSSSQNEFSHRQGSITSLPDEDDQITTASDPFIAQQNLSTVHEYSKTPNLDNDIQTASIDLEATPDINNEKDPSPIWEQSSQDISINNQNITRSDSTDELTTSLGFQQSIDQIDQSSTEISSTINYETIIRSQKLYYDPNPELIRKPQMITPIIYKQNIMVKFLKPPPIPLGPLIIREVRPPQPPPPPPLVIRQRPPPPLSPPPIILREKPPRAPAILTTQVLTKTLPPLPPPPRSVIIEKLPPLPPKPRDIVIERWIPYEATAYKRKVIIQRAAEPKPQPPPRNVIITYDKVEPKIIRQFQRHGIIPEDPENYTTRYGNSLFDTKDLLSKIRELGITEDISIPHVIDREIQEQLNSQSSEQNISYENSFQSTNIESENYVYDNYAPTFDNLMSGPSFNYDEFTGQENFGDDLSTQLAQYGLTADAIPY